MERSRSLPEFFGRLLLNQLIVGKSTFKIIGKSRKDELFSDYEGGELSDEDCYEWDDPVGRELV